MGNRTRQNLLRKIDRSVPKRWEGTMPVWPMCEGRSRWAAVRRMLRQRQVTSICEGHPVANYLSAVGRVGSDYLRKPLLPKDHGFPHFRYPVPTVVDALAARNVVADQEFAHVPVDSHLRPHGCAGAAQVMEHERLDAGALRQRDELLAPIADRPPFLAAGE